MENPKQVDPDEVFARLGGTELTGPMFVPPIQTTGKGTPYLQLPGVSVLAMPVFFVEQMGAFLSGFDETLGFGDYCDDEAVGDSCENGAELIKAAGQLCYMSFGPSRTRNADAQKYINNILASSHGSVLEHAQYSFLLYGAGRDFTHELVRHRAGTAFSQVSQRYVDGKTLRFVERPEYQNDVELHEMFEQRIDTCRDDFDKIATALMQRQAAGNAALSGEKRTELRKKVNQCARSLLPNETEAPIVMSANVRALRHIMEMRAAGPADVPIRAVTSRIFLCMQRVEPTLFADYKMYEAADGTFAVATDWRKV